MTPALTRLDSTPRIFYTIISKILLELEALAFSLIDSTTPIYIQSLSLYIQALT